MSNIADHVVGSPAAEPGRPLITNDDPGVIEQRKILKRFTICWWVGIPASIVILGIPLVIIAFIDSSRLLYRAWDRMQTRKGTLTPGKAVGFCFIPFFGFYWIFEAYCTLSKEMNQAIAREGIKHPPLSFGFAIAAQIITIIGCIPYIGVVALIPFVIMHFILMRRISQATEALIIADAATATLA